MREAIEAYILILPTILGLVIFTAGPVLASLYFSFTRWNLLSSPKWQGLDNYIELFTNDPIFWVTIRNTALYVLGTVPTGTVLALLLAIALNQRFACWRSFAPSTFARCLVGGGNLRTLALALPGRFWLNQPVLALSRISGCTLVEQYNLGHACHYHHEHLAWLGLQYCDLHCRIAEHPSRLLRSGYGRWCNSLVQIPQNYDSVDLTCHLLCHHLVHY